MSDERRRRLRISQETIWSACLIVVAILRLGSVVLYRGPMDHIFSDPSRHLDNGRHFLEPGPMGCTNAYFYQLFLYVVITLTKEKPFLMNLVNGVLCAAYPYIWYRTALAVKVRRINALRFAAVLSILPTHTVMFQYFMTESLLLPLIGLSMWASVVAAQRRTAWRFLLAALLWTCTLLTRSISAPLAVLVLGYALYHQSPRPILRRPLLGLMGAAIAAGGLWIAAQHSRRILEYATPFGDNLPASIAMVSASQGFQITFKKPKHYTYTYVFSSPSFYISPFDPFYDWKTIRTGTFKYTANIDKKGEDLKQIYWEQFNLHKHLLPRLIYENLIFMTFGHAWPESNKDNTQGKLCLHERWIWFPLMLTALVGSAAFMIRRRKVYFTPAVAVFALGVLYSAQFAVMEARYRKPIEPIVLLAIFWIINARFPRRAR